jgi:hypothetical protein
MNAKTLTKEEEEEMLKNLKLIMSGHVNNNTNK